MSATLRLTIVALALLLTVARPASAQVGAQELLARLDADGSVLGPGEVSIELAGFEHDDRAVEALYFRPAGDGPFPALLLIPGHGMSARGWLTHGVAFARAGYACLAITQPGYGGSDGPPDFVGPHTLGALTAGWELLAQRPEVDPNRRGIVGYSRGAMAAALLATELPDVRAAVLAGGIYDFRRAYEETVFDGIRANMDAETGMTEAAVAARSAVLRMERIEAAVLILHGGKDLNAPVSQAELLAQRLTELGKPHELLIFPEAEHSIGLANFRESTLDFLGRTL